MHSEDTKHLHHSSGNLVLFFICGYLIILSPFIKKNILSPIDFSWHHCQKWIDQEVPVVAQWILNLTSIHKDASSIPGLPLWVKDSSLLVAVV